MPPLPSLSMVWFYDMDALRLPAGVTRHAVAMRHALAAMAPEVSLKLATGRIMEPNNLATWETWDDLPRVELPLSTRAMVRYWRLFQWPPMTTWTGPTDWIYAPAELMVAKGQARLAVTSHDIAQDLRWQPPRRKLLLDKLFQTADRVFSVSRFNTGQLLNAYPHLEGRVSLVPNAADDLFQTPATAEERAAVRQQLGIPEQMPFLLSVANFQPRKNLEALVRAAARLPQVAAGEMAVVLVGEGSEEETRRLTEVIRSLKTPRLKIHLPGYLQGVALRAAYAEASALVFTSLCESFGIPVLEAMSQGCPVALASSSGLPEVGREAGWYFQPTVEDEITDVVGQLLNNEKVRQERILMGRAISQEYRWDASARMLIDALRSETV